MDLMNNNEVSPLVESFKNLDSKYQSFLEREGRWLGGSLTNVLTNTKNSSNEDVIQVKRDVFNMLPSNIKADIISLVQV
ncbi:hypothetical protein GQF61_01455 [Sphingobacterium sp. DK4209]|uniref:Uncharacterized protein n=1 Tax=Sphingobacterium zhuxiongii TaxID=2662364 RepID=A0A5Q0Q6Y7_9SPHI|nr:MULTISPECIES: hypothetical protein [unclassified Sphingobacterium]MVZ64504.1 hypothetical protein [Sphingobacterium sp. DK4209]QGA25835.1 hypothetical protein GFH32_05665 [Sphingobacterium sp. dk4302]